MLYSYLVFCTLIVGIVAVAKYKIAKLDWESAKALAELAKEASK